MAVPYSLCEKDSALYERNIFEKEENRKKGFSTKACYKIQSFFFIFS